MYSGTLTECYDELGNRYQLPVYVLSGPTNMMEEHSETDQGQESNVSMEAILPGFGYG